MSLSRAYSVLHVKSVDTDQRVFRGMATTPEVDRVGDIIEPKGAKFSNPLSLLLYHDHAMPVGRVKFSKPTDAGIEFEAHIPEVTESGTLKDRVDEAWQSVKHGLIRGVSVGFRTLEDGVELMRSGGYRFTKIEILELSLVAIPANAAAVISTIKSIDAPYLAESGVGAEHVRPHSSAVVDPVKPQVRKGTATAMSKKTTADQIAGLEATRVEKSAALNELQEKVTNEGRTKDANERQSFDDLKDEIAGIDAELKDLRDLQDMNVAAAVAAPVAKTVEAASAARGGHAVTVKDPSLPPGIGFARYAIAGIMARKQGTTIEQFAKSRWPGHSALHQYVQKATVPAGLTTDATWAGNLVDTTNLAGEFLEYLRPQTIIGRIPGLRRVPFNVRIVGQSTGAVANWVGQGKPKPVTSFGTTATTLLFTKIAAIAVITDELARFSSPSAETLVRDELARAVIERMDVDFIDPAQAAVSGVSPASITNGVTPLSPSGTAEANVRTDIITLLAQFMENNVDVSGLVLVMPPTLAMSISLMVNSLGQPSFPGMGMSGGNLLGIPVVTSNYAANQSGSGNLVIALNARDIALADDGQVTLDSSREASIQMTDAPTNDSSTGTGQSLVSMYQTNSVAIRAERFINWAKLRTNAVSFIDDVNWGSVGSPG